MKKTQRPLGTKLEKLDGKPNLKKLLKSEMYLTVFPILAGIYIGYHNSQGISFEDKFTKELVHGAPMLAEIVLGAFLGPAYVTDVYDKKFLKNNSEPKDLDLVACGSISIVGAVLGGLKGKCGIALGYGIGSLAGYVMK